MARTSLLPGMGGRATLSLALTSGGAAAVTDELDCSRCAQIAAQVTTWTSGNLSVRWSQSIDGTNFAFLGTATVMVVGDIIRLPITSGPFGIMRLSVTSSDTSATVTFTIVGYEVQQSA